MRFESLAAFVHMDGQGVYIWAAYSVTLVVLAANVFLPLLARRRIVQQAKRAIDLQAAKLEERQ